MDLTARNDQIVSLAKSGFNGAEIARMYGLTRAAISQILRRFGASRSPRKVFGRFDWEQEGIPEHMRQMLTDNGAMKAFLTHRNNALRRGVEFKFTFAEWWRVWDESGKWHQRGRFKGQYVMSRHQDRGAYEVGNVSIVLATVNCSEGLKLRKFRPVRAHNCLASNTSSAAQARTARRTSSCTLT